MFNILFMVRRRFAIRVKIEGEVIVGIIGGSDGLMGFFGR